MGLNIRVAFWSALFAIILVYVLNGNHLGIALTGGDAYTLEVRASSNANSRWTIQYVHGGDAFVDVGNRHKKYSNEGSSTQDLAGNGETQILSFRLPVDKELDKLRFQIENDLLGEVQNKKDVKHLDVESVGLLKNGEQILRLKGRKLKGELQNNKGLFRQNKSKKGQRFLFKRKLSTLALKRELSKIDGFNQMEVQDDPRWFYQLSFFFAFALFYVLISKLPVPQWKELGLYDFLLAMIFIGILILSNLQLKYPMMEVANTEKRGMYAAPDFDWKSPEKYLKGLTLFYRENFGFRNHFIRLHNLMKYYVFGVSPVPQKVHVGKEGWLFKELLLKDIVCTKPLSERELNKICKNAQNVQRKFHSQGIKYYILLPTEKGIIYPEYMPFGLSPQNSIRRQVSEALRAKTNIPVIDTEEVLKRYKEKYFLYYKYDFHWNEIAGFIGYQLLMEELSKDFGPFEVETWEDVDLKKGISEIKGLSYTIALHKELSEKTQYVVPKREHQWNERRRVKGAPKGTRVTMVDKPKLPSALIVHDSFFASIKPFLANHFSSAIYLQNEAKANNPRLEAEFVKRHKPDMVIHEFMIHTDYDLITLFGI